MMRRFWCYLVVVLLTALVQSPAHAQESPRPPEVSFPSGKLLLRGFVYKPAGDGPFPAVLWNHGSERLPGWLPQLGPLFVSKGYVLFIPHRRGQGLSSGAGEYIMDALAKAQEQSGPAARSRQLVELMQVHLEDQEAALAYLKSLPYVDAKRVAVAGCSFGGIQTLLAAAEDLGLRAAVDFAGGAESWRGSPDLRDRMTRAARGARVPVFFIQAKNDYDTSPSEQLAKEMEKAGKPHQIHIFPRSGKTTQEAHEFCIRGGEVWGGEAFDFLASAMAH